MKTKTKLKPQIPVIGRMPHSDHELLKRLAKRRMQWQRPEGVNRKMQPIAPFAL